MDKSGVLLDFYFLNKQKKKTIKKKTTELEGRMLKSDATMEKSWPSPEFPIEFLDSNPTD